MTNPEMVRKQGGPPGETLPKPNPARPQPMNRQDKSKGLGTKR